MMNRQKEEIEEMNRRPVATSNLDLILPLQCHIYRTMDKHLLHLQQLLLFLARLPFPETTMSVQGYTCPTKPSAGPNSSPVHRAGVPADQAAYPGRDKHALRFCIQPQALGTAEPGPSTKATTNPCEC